MTAEIFEDHEDPHKEKFDPTDSWDQYLVSIGKDLKQSKKEEWKSDDVLTDSHFFEASIDFVSGRMYEDDFGAWNPGSGDWVIERPEKLLDFDKKYLDETYRGQIDFIAIGQPDGPNTYGHVWAARVWDQKENKEVPNTRVFGNKLSHVVTEAVSKAPKWIHDIWMTEAKRAERKESNELASCVQQMTYYMALLNSGDSQSLANKTLIEQRSSCYKDIEAAGSIKRWIEAQIEKGKGIRTVTEELTEVLDIITSIVGHSEKAEGESLDQYDETDGWLPPPDWRG